MGVLPHVRRFASGWIVVIAAGLLAAVAPGFAGATEIFPVKDLAPGMRGFTLSDLGEGQGVQRFDVEIIGVLKSYAPKQDLVLARIHSEAIQKTGIIAGMSGSPVYVEGKLVGALAYGWPFSREPICGITPIQNMLDIRKAPATAPVPIGGAATRASAFMASFEKRDFATGFEDLLAPLRSEPASAGLAALPLPVSFSGAAGPGSLFDRVAGKAGWFAAPSGGGSVTAKAAAASTSPPATVPGERLEPGLPPGNSYDLVDCQRFSIKRKLHWRLGRWFIPGLYECHLARAAQLIAATAAVCWS
jgi:hypothetical protein